MQNLGLYRDIITGNMKGKSVTSSMGHGMVIKSYNQEMMLNIGDYVVLYGKPPHQRHTYYGTIVAFKDNRFQLADEHGNICYNCCPEGAVCIVKY